MATNQPTIRPETRVRVVETEVIIRDANRSVRRNRDRWQERLSVGCWNVQRRLVHTSRCRPRGASVRGHRESNVVVLEVGKTTVLPDRVQIAVLHVHRERRIGWILYELSRLPVDDEGFPIGSV